MAWPCGSNRVVSVALPDDDHLHAIVCDLDMALTSYRKRHEGDK